jgi:hypothetical protein
MAEPPRLTLADQALIHLLGYLGLEVMQDASWDTFRACLQDILPKVSRDISLIEKLAAIGDRIEHPLSGADLSFALEDARRQLRDYHKSKAARAIDEMKAAKEDAA